MTDPRPIGDAEDSAAEPAPAPVADEPEPPAGGDSSPPPAPSSGALTEADVEKALTQLAREATRHANAVSKIMGADANELEPCPLCVPTIPGFRFPVPLDEQQTAAVRRLLGLEQPADYKPADDARACEDCGALGKVTTGSQVPEHATKLCSHCGGTGWVNVQATPGNGAPPQLAALAPATGNGTSTAAPEPDAWGRPPGHPHYGLHPAYVT